MCSIKSVFVPLLVLVLAACGGGGSSSGGGEVERTIIFSGTYTTPIYSGSITIKIPPNSRPIVTLTGLSCLVEPFGETLTARIEGSVRVVGGTIPGGAFGANFPESGGTGSIFISAPEPCISSEGTLSIERG